MDVQDKKIFLPEIMNMLVAVENARVLGNYYFVLQSLKRRGYVSGQESYISSNKTPFLTLRGKPNLNLTQPKIIIKTRKKRQHQPLFLKEIKIKRKGVFVLQEKNAKFLCI